MDNMPVQHGTAFSTVNNQAVIDLYAEIGGQA
jgi:hypothetical protein